MIAFASSTRTSHFGGLHEMLIVQVAVTEILANFGIRVNHFCVPCQAIKDAGFDGKEVSLPAAIISASTLILQCYCLGWEILVDC